MTHKENTLWHTVAHLADVLPLVVEAGLAAQLIDPRAALPLRVAALLAGRLLKRLSSSSKPPPPIPSAASV
jgi:hypothetical protein